MLHFNKIQNKTLRRFLKNRGALVGCCFIALVALLAIFAYQLAPDGSTHANRRIIEIAGKKAGDKQLVYVQKPTNTTTTNFFNKMLNGTTDNYKYIPIITYSETTDSFFVTQLIDEGFTQPLAFKKSSGVQHIVQTLQFPLGTNKAGRDMLSMLLLGTRVSLSVGLVAVLISLTIGILLGALAGYYRGWVDVAIMWLINVVWSIPTILLVFAFTIALGKSLWLVFVAIGLTMWVNVARLVRGQVLKEREMQYVEAGKAMGFSNARVIFLHVIPNIMGPILVLAAGNFASAIIIEAGLSFLGVGVSSPIPSWGLMIKENYSYLMTSNPGLALIPGFAIMLLVLSFYLVGNGLRDALDVKG
jgi:ABC-type dipeptide/oligopeptide/nickel transport system permease subunit